MGFIASEPIIVRKLHPDELKRGRSGVEYEVIDGNHRVKKLQELGLNDMMWSARVVDVRHPQNK